MAERTGIEWANSTWNPTRGCTRKSEGCRFCYAEAVAARFSYPGGPYHGYADRDRPGSKWTGKVDVAWHLIDQPLTWRRPRRIFTGSMSDLFHEDLPAEEIACIFAVMVAAVHLRGHTFQVLTKRTARMRQILSDPVFWEQVNAEAGMHVMGQTDPLNRRTGDARATLDEYGPYAPPPGIWIGTSVENQDAAFERIPELIATPASTRFLSCEPLLGPIDLTRLPGPDETILDALRGHLNASAELRAVRPRRWDADGRVDWVIAGGESGPGARPMHLNWPRALRDQCAAAGIPFFFKQWGEWLPGTHFNPALRKRDSHELFSGYEGLDWEGSFPVALDEWSLSGDEMYRVGKARAGNTLDGRTHLAFPAEPEIPPTAAP